MNRKLNGQNVTCVIIDESTQIKPKPIASINPMRESVWLDVFSKQLKDKEDETEI